MLRRGETAPTNPEYPMTHVLIVSGDDAARRVLIDSLSLPRYEVQESASAAEALRRLESGPIDVVVTAARLPEGDAVAALASARDANPALSVVVVASGAPSGSPVPPVGVDLLTKPLRPEAVRAAVDRAAEQGRLRRENQSLKAQIRALQSDAAGGNGGGGGDASRPVSPNGNGNGGGNGHALREWIASLPESIDLRSLQADVEREIVQRALAASEGIAAQAARKLGLSRSDLAYKLRRLGIVRERPRS